MALVLQIVVGVMVLAALVIAYLGSKNWPIYQAILVACIFLAGIGFFYFAGRHVGHAQRVGQVRHQLAERGRVARKTIAPTSWRGVRGADGQPAKGVVQLQRDLAKLAADRGGAFRRGGR